MIRIELPLSEDEEVAALGLAARIMLAYDGGDGDHMAHLIDANPSAAFAALITMSVGLAVSRYGDGARECLHAIATSADLEDIGRPYLTSEAPTGDT